MKDLRVGYTVDQPKKEKLSELSRTFGTIYARDEYNALSLHMVFQ